MAMHTTTELFEFISRSESVWTGDFVKLKLDTSSGLIGETPMELEVSLTYDKGQYSLFGTATIHKNGRVLSLPLPDKAFKAGGIETLTSEVLNYIGGCYLLQRAVSTVQITSEGAVKI